MASSEDTAQRTLWSRLESDREDPRSRPIAEFRHPNLLGWIRENRARLVRAALVVLRAAMIADDAPDPGAVGSFEAWSSIVPRAILYAGGPNVLDARPRDGANDAGEGAAHATLMRDWPRELLPGTKLVSLIRQAFDHEREIERREIEPDGLDDFREAIRTLTNTQASCKPATASLGYALRSLRGKWRDGMRVMGTSDRMGVVMWRVDSRDRASKAEEISEEKPLEAQLEVPYPVTMQEQSAYDAAEDWDRKQ
jgi:hypothetical protein